MEQTYQKKEEQKNRKPIYILLGVLVLFGAFIYFITRPSLENKAIEQIQICTNVDDIKSVYQKYKYNILETDENGNKIVALEFQDAIRSKLNSLNLTEGELAKCLIWLPPAKTSLNVIVIPDLSRRIIDSFNNPNQIYDDTLVLNTIWHSFVNYSKLKQDSKDRLIVDVTDVNQARGQFGTVANQLQFDLSEHKGKSNRLYFTENKDTQFVQGITTLYALGKQKTLGADYVFYFKRYLSNRIRKSTLFDTYLNKIIILTDGYLETDDVDYTKITPQLYKSVSIGNTEQMITALGLNIPKAPINLSNTDVLVCEVNERQRGKGKDYEILKTYWEDWLKRMNVINPQIIPKEQASDLTRKRIEDFFKN